MNKKEQQLLSFLKGEGKDAYFRHIDHILNKDHNKLWLELTHNYIQWLFPLKEKSSAAYSIPLTDEMVEVIRNDEAILSNIKRAFAMMLDFYGFELDTNTDEIKVTSSKTKMIMHWLNPCNHNYLRITRILGCLSIVGMRELAKEWLRLLEEVTSGISYCEVSKEYWRDAINWE